MVDGLVNGKLCLPAQFPLHHSALVQRSLGCWRHSRSACQSPTPSLMKNTLRYLKPFTWSRGDSWRRALALEHWPSSQLFLLHCLWLSWRSQPDQASRATPSADSRGAANMATGSLYIWLWQTLLQQKTTWTNWLNTAWNPWMKPLIIDNDRHIHTRSYTHTHSQMLCSCPNIQRTHLFLFLCLLLDSLLLFLPLRMLPRRAACCVGRSAESRIFLSFFSFHHPSPPVVRSWAGLLALSPLQDTLTQDLCSDFTDCLITYISVCLPHHLQPALPLWLFLLCPTDFADVLKVTGML